jgi:superkiller protein 3
MKQIILAIAVLMLSLNITAQRKDNTAVVNNEQVYFTTPLSNYEGTVEPEVSTEARDLNNKGVEMALKQKNFEAATEFFRQAVQSDNRCFMCQYNLGMSLVSNEKYDESIKVFSALVSHKPTYANGYAGLAEVYGKKGLFKDSVSAYRKAAEFAPNDAAVLSNFGNALHQLGEYKQAIIYLDKAVEINPDLAVAQSNRGSTLYMLGRHKEAVKCLQRAVELQPNSAEVQNNLGVVLSSLGKVKQAQKHFLEALRLRPKWSFALYNLGTNFLDLGDRGAAQQQLSILENVDTELAKNFKKAFLGKYVINVSDVK